VPSSNALSQPSDTTAWHSKIGLRLLGAFSALLGLFVLALGVCAHSFVSISRAESDVAAFEQTRHAADRSSILMREQYIHQAHTLIVFDDSHLAHYGDVASAAAAAVTNLRRVLASAEDQPLVDELDRYRTESDRTFRQKTLPAVMAGDRLEATRVHELMERSVVDFSVVVRSLHERNDTRAAAAKADVEAAWARARVASLACLGFAVIVTIAVAVFLRRTVVRRIAALREGALRIGAGDLSARINLETRDELGALARAFDSMAAGLERHQEELVKTQKLASMGRVAAGVAHELNNPLGVILGYAKLLRRRGEFDPDALAVIEQEATLASEIVASMLDLTKPQALRLGDVDLGTLVRESTERLAQLSKFEDVRWNVGSLEDRLTVRGDEARLRQVLVNVLTNAAEAALPSGRVEVSLGSHEDGASVSVDDSGAGISGEQHPLVIEPFYTTKPHGAGLGLSIAHAIVEAHCGSLTFGSSPLGGARVTVKLPIRAEGAP